MKVYTIGHSTLDFDKFCDLLSLFGVQKLVDVRSYPGSRYVPTFNKETLGVALKNRNIDYVHFSKLGGRRKSNNKQDYTLVEGWQNESFRNYASYTLTQEYKDGIDELLEIGKNCVICLMCAESVPWKCHRSIISNTLVDRGVEVLHIMSDGNAIPHELNKYGATVAKKDGDIIYPKF